MKIRNGFVSNSSTSSFCLFGICVDRDKVIEAAKMIDSTFGDDSYDACEFVSKEIGLTYSQTGYDSGHACYIGRSPQSFKDDETGAQFKQSVRAAVEKFFPGEPCEWHEEAWYDG